MKNVERMSGTFKHRNYNLLEHSFGVLYLFRYFASKEDVPYGMEQVDVIMFHDCLESITGDLIYPVKNFNDETKKSWKIIEDELVKGYPQFYRYSDKQLKQSFTPLQYKLFKDCDYLDLWIFCKEEQSIGNSSPDLVQIIKKCEQLISGHFKCIIKYMLEYGK